MNGFAKVFIFLTLLTQSINSSANDTEFGGNGSLPIPIENNAISMISENISINGEDLLNPNKRGRWLYHCQFTFKNFTPKKQRLQMGFPFPIYNEEEAVTVPKGSISHPGDPLVYDFKVTTPNGPIPAVRSKIGTNKDKGVAYQEAYIWPMSFEPDQILKIEHSYSTGTTNDVMGFTWVSYVLKTGALWRGNQIGHTRIKISPNTPTRLCSEISQYKDIGTPILPGMKIVQKGAYRQYLWDLEHFKPKQDLTLCLQTGRDYVRYQLVYPLIGISSYPLPPLSSMSRSELRRMKNSIFAQYGRVFNDPELQHYFNQQWWYEPNPNYQDSLLTKEDKEAIKVLNAVLNK
ncbi:YARHG domain-containing protein [Legionella micdadei]|uniref:YARHG domain-containing protein n=1 Tax=Legionella micdadei TaxID=451 RepID=A0A098GHR7_LEGMI|nr:YARHG domain-containing protein [Legionella micdadei]KTD26785.1 hypothetical protein Lmic_2879 [Legionella micdadei]CEG61517.1 conserved exported protein of unknown function [Legionella micdadei]SCY44847.1 YARHG domain-containing protein [Legionella micdadei]